MSRKVKGKHLTRSNSAHFVKLLGRCLQMHGWNDHGD